MSTRRELSSPLRFADVGLGICAAVLACIGIALNYSASWRLLEFTGRNSTETALRQAAFVVLGIGVMVLVAFVDYRFIRDISWRLASVVGVMLALVLFFGLERRGARSWFEIPRLEVQLQPSEFAKITLIVLAAAYLSAAPEVLPLRSLGRMYAVFAVPTLLVLVQPDIGTALVFVVIGMGMLLVGGAQIRHIAVTTVCGVIGLVMVFSIDSLAGQELFLRDTQRERLTTFLNPDADTQGAAYNLQQSQIAVGSGGLTGQGFTRGTQTNLNLVPHQESDFIFTALAEEFGFLGSIIVLALYGFLIQRTFVTARAANSRFGLLACVGVLSMFLFQVFQNVGMTIGITPITGIPLPFLSHGGSQTITSFAAVGLVINIGARRYTV